MGDIIERCYLCKRYISIDDAYFEYRDDYGFPHIVCEDCHGKGFRRVSIPEYPRVPNCSWELSK